MVILTKGTIIGFPSVVATGEVVAGKSFSHHVEIGDNSAMVIKEVVIWQFQKI